MSKCLAVPRKTLEEMPLWQTLNRVEGIISAAILLSPSEIEELLGIIKNSGVFLERKGPDGIEENPKWQQIIFYGLVMQGNKFFLYRRGETTYKEERLRSMVSVGVGGHIEPFDAGDLINSLKREIGEELKLSENGIEIPINPNIKVVGLIKDEKDGVGKVHLGLVCLIELTDGIEVAIKSNENVWGQMVTHDEYQQMVSSSDSEYTPEGWTELLIKHIAIPLFRDR